MTAMALQRDTLNDLDAGTRRAWAAYRDRLRRLSGEEYEDVEREGWDELQGELGRLDRRRRMLGDTAA